MWDDRTVWSWSKDKSLSSCCCANFFSWRQVCFQCPLFCNLTQDGATLIVGAVWMKQVPYINKHGLQSWDPKHAHRLQCASCYIAVVVAFWETSKWVFKIPKSSAFYLIAFILDQEIASWYPFDYCYTTTFLVTSILGLVLCLRKRCLTAAVSNISYFTLFPPLYKCVTVYVIQLTRPTMHSHFQSVQWNWHCRLKRHLLVSFLSTT